MSRYDRQILLPQIGPAGQDRLSRAGAVLVGCGAFGTVIAEQLARAGIGRLRIVDRDLVEESNLQRQVLFDQSHADRSLPKAIAAAERLRQINPMAQIDPIVADVHSGNVESLIADQSFRADVILDGTDNVETRFLLNDVAVKHGIPWVYGACVGTGGRVMSILPQAGPCLRCIFPEPPGAGELETCETAGVLAAAASIVASLQVVAAMRILLDAPALQLITIEAWDGRFKNVDVADARRSDCPTCGKRRFEFLKRSGSSAATLCGRGAVQVRPAPGSKLDLSTLADRLRAAGDLAATPYFLRLKIAASPLLLTIFPDGRALIHGTSDPALARSVYARYIGT